MKLSCGHWEKRAHIKCKTTSRSSVNLLCCNRNCILWCYKKVGQGTLERLKCRRKGGSSLLHKCCFLTLLVTDGNMLALLQFLLHTHGGDHCDEVEHIE